MRCNSLIGSRVGEGVEGRKFGVQSYRPNARAIVGGESWYDENKIEETAMPQTYKCISGDTHLEIPNERWTHRIDKQYRDRAPRTIRLEGGADATVFEDR